MTPQTKQSNQNTLYELILYQDNSNDINWIILSLIQICGHSQTQAEQCVYILKNKGSVVISTGYINLLEYYKKELENRTFTLEIK